MATNDGSRSKRAEAQPARSPASAAGTESKHGETLPQATVAYSGPKQGLPQVFGRYRVQKLLGGGGMGAVYLVINTELEREEALKVPHFDAAADPAVHKRFLREAKAAAGLDHPNLCPVYDVGVLDGIYYLTMRHLKGKLLSAYSGTAQPVRKAVEVVTKLAQALTAAHARGVIHRDLKPNNVIMCAGVGPVVMDFGLAKQTGRQDRTLTRLGTTLGTPAYMPPEQVKGELERIGPASDVYSLGVILFELLTGRLPFEGGTAAEVYGKILYIEAPAPSSLRPGLPAALDAVCARAMAKAPGDRHRSMKEFAAALIEYLKAAPPAEGAGELKAVKEGPANIFQVATVVPDRARPKAPVPGRPRASGAKPRTTAGRGKGSGGRPWHAMLGWALSIVLILGGLGGVGTLIYVLNHKTATPPPDHLTTPVRSPNDKGLSLEPNGTAQLGNPMTPLIGIQFHDQVKEVQLGTGGIKSEGKISAKASWDPTMRFGLVMLNQTDPKHPELHERLTFDEEGLTNNCCVRLDDQESLFGEQPFREEGKPPKVLPGRWSEMAAALGKGASGRQRQGKRSVWVYGIEKVEITQTVEVVFGRESGRLDTCLVRYRIDNKDDKPHSVGLRFLLDTFIGTKDGAPFLIPGRGQFCATQQILEGDSVPQYVQACEEQDLTKPGVIARLQLRLDGDVETPNRVTLGAYPDPALGERKGDPHCLQEKTLWDVPVYDLSILNDSAVTMYWNARPIDPGASREMGFAYGLGDVAADEGGGKLGLSVGGSFTPGGEISVSAYVSNPIPGQTVTLNLPAGVRLIGGDLMQDVPTPSGAVGRMSPVSWKVKADGAGEYTIRVESSNGAMQTKRITVRTTSAFGDN